MTKQEIKRQLVAIYADLAKYVGSGGNHDAAKIKSGQADMLIHALEQIEAGERVKRNRLLFWIAMLVIFIGLSLVAWYELNQLLSETDDRYWRGMRSIGY